MTDLPLNPAKPLVMHIDMNSCFASVEQQANRLLRGKAIGVVANDHRTGTIISPSYEAKRFGIKTGFRVFQAREILPKIQIIKSDPDKYFYVHKKFAEIFRDYSPDVVALSIDEAAINFEGMPKINLKRLVSIGYEIKQRIKAEIGDWLTCNVGISTNRFLAKLGASLHKPDGLDVITSDNLREVYKSLELVDLCGINVRYERRLNLAGIRTPLDFLEAPVWKLRHQVFHSIVGYYWYMRLRGYEIDTIEHPRRSYGQGYHLHHFTAENQELSKLMMKLCEKMGRRLRRAGMAARGIAVYASFERGYLHKGHKFGGYMYATLDLYDAAMALLNHRPADQKVTQLSVSCFDLAEAAKLTLPLFEGLKERRIKIANATDAINNHYGEYVVYSAKMFGLDNEIVKRVPFHATTDTLSEIYDNRG